MTTMSYDAHSACVLAFSKLCFLITCMLFADVFMYV